MLTSRRTAFYIALLVSFIIVLFRLDFLQRSQGKYIFHSKHHSNSFSWRQLPQHYPVDSFINLPSGRPRLLPEIQNNFLPETPEIEQKRLQRLRKVKENFAHAWNGYKTYAWAKDEVAPLSGSYYDTFGGWAATLVDSLDSLYIMGFKEEFNKAVDEVANLNFTTAVHEELNVFETTIRYIGGLLAAYDLSGKEILLQKAVELGDMMYVAFDTPNRMPITRWKWQDARNGSLQEAQDAVISAEIGSLSLEFTRLSQLTRDYRYFDAIQRVTLAMRDQQDQTKLPGIWPVFVNPRAKEFSHGSDFGLGAMADSLYEYLPKEFMLLGGLHEEYRHMYEKVITTAKDRLFFRPQNKENLDILLSGTVHVDGSGLQTLDTQGQHLVCFVGGMVATAARLFERPGDMDVARKLVDGCIWAYNNTITGLMPETFHAVECEGYCDWDENIWHNAIRDRYGEKLDTLDIDSLIKQERLSPGFADIPDRRYILRPEAIESIFMLYRITGDESLRDRAWNMFEAVEEHARTPIAHAVIDDVTSPDAPQGNRMETFWTAETLKYYYLLYAEPSVISLDEYVFNTEAHPFRRPR